MIAAKKNNFLIGISRFLFIQERNHVPLDCKHSEQAESAACEGASASAY
jgi:hypothetical protein